MQKHPAIQSIVTGEESLKGQKIAAALYLVTNHLSDSDPVKHMIRTHAVALLETTHDKIVIATKIVALLRAAVLAQMVSEQNVSILSQEIGKYTQHHSRTFGSLFDEVSHTDNSIQKQRHAVDMSVMSDKMSVTPKKYVAIFENKNKRQNQILSFINDRKAVGIKDISTLFTDVSEKTIQRELSTLVETGKITKRGSKRWSIYMTVV